MRLNIPTAVIKISNIVGNIPEMSELNMGEFALNIADAKLYTLFTSGNTHPIGIREVGFNSSGSSAASFGLRVIGSSPNTSGATFSGNILTLQPASQDFGGVVTTTSQIFSGNKLFNNNVEVKQGLTFSNSTYKATFDISNLNQNSTILLPNVGGSYNLPLKVNNIPADGNGNIILTIPDSGVTNVNVIGNLPNANGAFISGNILTLQPASQDFGGVVTTTSQIFSGNKTYLGQTTAQGNLLSKGDSVFRVENLAGGRPSNSSEDGVEIFTNSGSGKIQGYNPTTGLYIPMKYESSNNIFYGTNNFLNFTALGTLNTPTERLDVVGNVKVSGSINNYNLSNDTLYFPSGNYIQTVGNSFNVLTSGNAAAMMSLGSLYISNGFGALPPPNGIYALGNIETSSYLKVGALATGVTPPITTGTIKMVVTDIDGLLSTISIPSSGITYTGSAPIVVSGSVISVNDASVSQSGVVTIGTQTFGGDKTFTGTVITTKDITVNQLTIGKGGGNQPDNTVLGFNSLLTNTSGTRNIAIGNYVLPNITTGIGNTGIGYGALNGLVVGNANLGIGSYALFSNTGSNNVALGNLSAYDNTTGFDNTFVGVSSFQSNVTGIGNTGLGYLAMVYATSGDYNTIIGHKAGMFVNSLAENTSANYATFLGTATKSLATGQTNEIVIGYNAQGKGTNTVVLGNDAITNTHLKGSLIINAGSGFAFTTSIFEAKATVSGFGQQTVFNLDASGNFTFKDKNGATSFYSDYNGATRLYTTIPLHTTSIVNSGNVTIEALRSGQTPPTSAGTTKMVVTDVNGKLSFGGVFNYEDNRTITPFSALGNEFKYGFGSFNNDGTAPYADFLHLNSFINGTGQNQNLVVFNKQSIGMRVYQATHGNQGLYSVYKDVAFISDLPTGGASGNYVDRTTAQTIAGEKTFTSKTSFNETVTQTGNSDFRIQGTGSGSVPASWTGVGIDFIVIAGVTSSISSINRTGAPVAAPLVFTASNYQFQQGNVSISNALSIGGSFLSSGVSNFRLQNTGAGVYSADATGVGLEFNVGAGITPTFSSVNRTSGVYVSSAPINLDGSVIRLIGRGGTDIATFALGGNPPSIKFKANGDIEMAGVLKVGTLATGLTAPTTVGSTKMIISDSTGLLSFTDIPVSQPAGWSLTGNTLIGTEKFGSLNNQPLKFYTNNLNTMTLDSSGSLTLNNIGGNIILDQGLMSLGSFGGNRELRSYGSISFTDYTGGGQYAQFSSASSIFFGTELNLGSGLNIFRAKSSTLNGSYFNSITSSPQAAHVPTNLFIGMTDYDYFGNNILNTGHIYIKGSKNTTNNVEGNIILNYNGTAFGGNTLINTTTNTGEQLQVEGSTKIDGWVTRINSDGNSITFGKNISTNVYFGNNLSGVGFKVGSSIGNVDGTSRVILQGDNSFILPGVNAVNIGDINSIPSSLFTVATTSKGSIPSPVLTTTQRNAILNPVKGLQVFNSTTNAPNYYDGTTWLSSSSVAGANTQIQYNSLSAFGATSAFTYNGTNTLQINGMSFVCNTASNIGITFTNNGVGGVLADGIYTINNAGAGLKIGAAGTHAHSSAQLELLSTTRGFLTSRMTTTQRDAITTPATGLEIYNTTTNEFNYYNGTAWVSSINFTASNGLTKTASNVAINSSLYDATTGNWTLAGGSQNRISMANGTATGNNSVGMAGGTTGGPGVNSVGMAGGFAYESNSVSMAGGNTSGKYSVGMSFGTPNAYGSVAIGYNESTDAPNPSSPASTDRIFQIGNGTSAVRTNAITILRNGRVGLGILVPTEVLDVVGNVKINNLTISGVGSTTLASTLGLFVNAVNGLVLQSTSGTVNIATSSLNRLTVLANGNIGINQIAPSEMLEIGGALKLSNSPYIGLTNNATTPVPTGGAGTIVFDSGSFFGWNGTAWKQLDN